MVKRKPVLFGQISRGTRKLALCVYPRKKVPVRNSTWIANLKRRGLIKHSKSKKFNGRPIYIPSNKGLQKLRQCKRR